MTQTAEVRSLYRAVDDLRAGVDAVRRRYGEIPAVQRLVGDLDRLNLDAHEFDAISPPAARTSPPIEYIPDEPVDHTMFVGADDEGVGGYHGGTAR
jgi:hypothetical protein